MEESKKPRVLIVSIGVTPQISLHEFIKIIRKSNHDFIFEGTIDQLNYTMDIAPPCHGKSLHHLAINDKIIEEKTVQEPIFDEPKSKYINRPQRNYRKR